MYNYNSPIVNGWMNNNIIPFGGLGYNMGNYYNNCNNVYNQFYNPYVAIEQERLRQEEMRKQTEKQNNIRRELIEIAYEGQNGEAPPEEFLEQFEERQIVIEPKEIDEEEEIVKNLLRMEEFNEVRNAYIERKNIERIVEINRKNKEVCPDSMGIKEFSEISGEIYAKQLERERRIKERDVSTLYNSNDWNKLLESKGSLTYFNKLNENINIDDMELNVITPTRLQKNTEYEEKKRRFIASFINKG